MIVMRGTLLLMSALALLVQPVAGGERPADQAGYLQASQGGTVVALSSREDSLRDRGDLQLAKLQADFEKFARAKVEEMNRNHRISRSRMQISKRQDGSYDAVFHQIDSASVTCQVSRSQSSTIPYVAVLKYQEQVLAASGSTPDHCRKGQFTPVGVIPNRHIFSYNKGSWQ